MVDVGDLLVTRGAGWAARLIRLGAALLDEPNIDNHVAIVHHRDDAGVWWAVEGRPGGVGWADARTYLASAYTTNNVRQAKTADQRAQIATVAQGMLGTPYDWEGIVADAMDAINVQDLWAQNWNGQGPPAHVVCSSLAAYVYQKVGLEIPTAHEPRQTTPADWEQFIIAHHFAETTD
ncbi:MAG TPA: hypothetical protein VJ870_12675 [Amycolatopsis sp.]|nr:hypothetical protein [Amycolatopsis sp.]